MRELSQRTARVLALVRTGETVEVTDRGVTVARIVPAVNDRYQQLIAAGIIRQAKHSSFDVARLPQPVNNPSNRTIDDLLDEFRGERS